MMQGRDAVNGDIISEMLNMIDPYGLAGFATLFGLVTIVYGAIIAKKLAVYACIVAVLFALFIIGPMIAPDLSAVFPQLTGPIAILLMLYFIFVKNSTGKK
jgi:hypothetical protein